MYFFKTDVNRQILNRTAETSAGTSLEKSRIIYFSTRFYSPEAVRGIPRELLEKQACRNRQKQDSIEIAILRNTRYAIRRQQKDSLRYTINLFYCYLYRPQKKKTNGQVIFIQLIILYY